MIRALQFLTAKSQRIKQLILTRALSYRTLRGSGQHTFLREVKEMTKPLRPHDTWQVDEMAVVI